MLFGIHHLVVETWYCNLNSLKWLPNTVSITHLIHLERGMPPLLLPLRYPPFLPIKVSFVRGLCLYLSQGCKDKRCCMAIETVEPPEAIFTILGYTHKIDMTWADTLTFLELNHKLGLNRTVNICWCKHKTNPRHLSLCLTID